MSTEKLAVKGKPAEVITFAVGSDEFEQLARLSARMQVQAGADIAKPGAFTIRNHSFQEDRPGAFTIRNHNFSMERPGAYTIRNYRFERG